MKRALLSFAYCLLSLFSQAQYNLPQNKIWALGFYAGLDFSNPGNPVPFTTSMQGFNDEGCASVSGGEGHLLFYSNGQRVWDSTHSVMPHGHDIQGLGNMGPTVSQGTLIVPFPNNPEKFYLFTLQYITGMGSLETMKTTLYSNVVDMSLNGGLGDIDTTFSLYGVALDDSLSEKMTVARGCNQNLWVIVHKKAGDIFHVFEIKTSGIETTPVVSSLPTNTTKHYLYGVMKMNPAGDKLLLCDALQTGLALPSGAGAYLYNFDPVMGTLFNRVPLDSMNGYYGGAFSPDGTKLYAQGTLPYGVVNQFNLSAPNPYSTKTSIASSPSLWSDLKLGPDGKIYMASGTSSPGSNRKYISRIDVPNSAGPACNFQDTIPGVNFLNAGTSRMGIGLPNDIVLPINGGTEEYQLLLDTIICTLPANGLLLQAPSGFYSYIWNDTTAGISKTVDSRGTYWVRYRTSGCNWHTDTFRISGGLPDLSIIFSNNTLSTTHTYTTYQWYKEGQIITGATGQACVPTSNGWYSVKVTGGPYNCSDSAAILVGASGIVLLEDLKDYIHIYPNPAQDEVVIDAPVPVRIALTQIAGKQLIEERQKRVIDIRHIPDGLYFLRICDRQGRFLKTEKLVIRHHQ